MDEGKIPFEITANYFYNWASDRQIDRACLMKERVFGTVMLACIPFTEEARFLLLSCKLEYFLFFASFGFQSVTEHLQLLLQVLLGLRREWVTLPSCPLVVPSLGTSGKQLGTSPSQPSFI